jgi:hypothetical protein
LAIVLLYNDQKKGQTIQWPRERTDNAMAKRKDKQYNGQKKGQTIQWPKEMTDNTLAKRKDRQYTGQNKGQTIQWQGHCIVCFLQFRASNYLFGIFKLFIS